MLHKLFYLIAFLVAIQLVSITHKLFDYLLTKWEQEDCQRIKAEIKTGNIFIKLPEECK